MQEAGHVLRSFEGGDTGPEELGWGTGCDRHKDVQGAPAGSVPTGALPVSTVGRGRARGPIGTDMFGLHLCAPDQAWLGGLSCSHPPPLNLTHFPFRWVVLNSTHHLLSGGHHCPGPLWHEGDPGDSGFLLMPQRGHVTGMQGQPLGSLDVSWRGVCPVGAGALGSGKSASAA